MEVEYVTSGKCECCGLKFSPDEFHGYKRDGIAYCEGCDEERLESWRAQEEYDAWYGYSC